MRSFLCACLAPVAVVLCFAPAALAQGVTTASISGVVTDANRTPVSGASVIAIHQPSGTTYSARTRADGRVSIPGMRVGGPYRLTVSSIGFGAQVKDNVFLTLGVSTDLEFIMRQIAVTLDEIVVTGVFSSERTGAATSVGIQSLQTLPTITRRIEDFARLTPQASGFSFVGQDTRLNNVTVDGSYFNNSFGLAGQPGERTGVAPISLDAN